MKPSSVLSLARQSTPASLKEASASREVRLRTTCMVEYSVQPSGDGDGDESSTSGSGRKRGKVLLSVYVPHCMLNPDQVRIVEV